MTSLIDFDITASPGAGLGFHYTPGTADSTSTALPFLLVLATPSFDNVLEVTFSSLTPAGAAIALGAFDSFEQTAANRRVIVAGQVVGATDVPEPATTALAGVGMLALVRRCIRRRRVVRS
jgi:hypothetical protein